MDDNIIEIINNDYIIDIDDVSYNLQVENLIVTDYIYAVNKPKINSIELTGNKSSEDLGLVSIEEMPLKEDISNKVVTVNEDSTDIQYPSAKCLYELNLQNTNIDLSNLSSTGQSKFDAKANVATTLSGYGITDAYTKSELDAKPHITEAYENGSDGYVIWSNGFCIQWGTISVNPIANVTVNLLKTYKNTNYIVHSQLDVTTTTPNSDNLTNQNVSNWAKTVNSFVTRCRDGNLQKTWHTIGYLAQGEY